VSPPNRDSAKYALATDQELWKARSFPEPNAARDPRWEPTWEPFPAQSRRQVRHFE
jgi:hypothetical protein